MVVLLVFGAVGFSVWLCWCSRSRSAS